MDNKGRMAEQLTKLSVEHFMTCVSFHVVSRLRRERGISCQRYAVTATEATLPH